MPQYSRGKASKYKCPATLRAEATVASADNHSNIFYRASAKFVTRFISKINCQVCHQMMQVSRE